MSKVGYTVGFMFALTLVCATGVSLVQIANQDRIALNQQVKLESVILRALGVSIPEDVDGHGIDALFQQRVTRREIGARTVYISYQADGKTPSGYAFPVDGPGFWGPVYAMVAVDAAISTIIGIEFYRHVETPGLGARISEKWFQQQFAGLSLNGSGMGPKYVTLTPVAPGKPPGELDAITGATMTSKAVEKMLNRELATLRGLLLPKKQATLPHRENTLPAARPPRQ